ncbi:acyltransferase family protein [Chitinophaga skermanii]|nr:acyltransferase [Chitinophaga skermanii]
MSTLVKNRVLWVDHLRSFITILVIAHHASLAYTTFAHFEPAAYISSTAPIVDAQRSKVLDIFEDFNDVFFMSLMFLISGIFVTPSLLKKSQRKFLHDRWKRLMIPFIVGVTLLMPIAYIPSYIVAYGKFDPIHFIKDYVTVEGWPVGPPWFIWVLFAFNLVFACIFPFIRTTWEKLGNRIVALQGNTLLFLLVWFVFTWLLYVPMVMQIDAGKWVGIGPLMFQYSRILLYAGYFLLGTIIGTKPLQEGILGNHATWLNKPIFYVILGIGAYAFLKYSEGPLTRMMKDGTITETAAYWIYRSSWTLSCVASCWMFIVLFKFFSARESLFWQKMSPNAFGMYLVHYIFNCWLQFSLMNIALHAIIKWLIVFVGATVLSYGLMVLARKNKVIENIM